jgi:hypothetical protein
MFSQIEVSAAFSNCVASLPFGFVLYLEKMVSELIIFLEDKRVFSPQEVIAF